MKVLFKLAVCAIVLMQYSDVRAKIPKVAASAAVAYRLPAPTATIQQGMRLRCRFVAETRLNRRNGILDGNVSTKADKEMFQFDVVDGRLVLAGNAETDRLRTITNAPGESAFFIEETTFRSKALWSFHRVEKDVILAVKQISIRDLAVSEIRILSTAANCAVTGGNGIAVTK
jgi:hypothetical protein